MKSRYIKTAIIFIVGTILLSSCATIVSKSTYPLSIESEPNNAKVSITDKNGKEVFLGNTPATVKLKAGSGFFTRAEYQVKFSSPGCEDKVVPVTFKIDGWYFGNILFGGLIGMLIVDPATGAMWKIETDYLKETLEKSANIADAEMKIVDINDIQESWKSHLVRVN
ncbi:PEGA domain-containing protein [Anaerorudis cellulosivorans]|uniref:PEGA domain-containing protein n=1 Tax=Anaerorudis cellulosivorans TaxID=3397862 RepID=UPI00221EEF78|nr:PEGA domain-containing protein [Seramator thermalis]MCW1734442.1 PEGA domain-containing protein [Seramator thermalis]